MSILCALFGHKWIEDKCYKIRVKCIDKRIEEPSKEATVQHCKRCNCAGIFEKGYALYYS